MSRIRNTLILSSATLTLLAAGLHLQAQPGNEAYYSTNIDDAVAHAKNKPTDQRYVGKTWYNRSTSQSFDFPKMLNSEMNDEVIEGAVGATAAGDQRDAVVDEPVLETSLGRNSIEPDETNSISPSVLLPEEIPSAAGEAQPSFSTRVLSNTELNVNQNVTISAQTR